jgi:hypothetical protein
MVIQHDAEKARYQDLKGECGGSQDKNREVIAAWNPGNCPQDICPQWKLAIGAIGPFRPTLNEIP